MWMGVLTIQLRMGNGKQSITTMIQQQQPWLKYVYNTLQFPLWDLLNYEIPGSNLPIEMLVYEFVARKWHLLVTNDTLLSVIALLM